MAIIDSYHLFYLAKTLQEFSQNILITADKNVVLQSAEIF